MEKQFILTVLEKEKRREYKVNQTDTILDVLQKEHIYLPCPCNGKGKCGKCKVKIVSGDTLSTSLQQELLSEEELSAGIRLACCTTVKSDVSITLYADVEQEFQVVYENTANQIVQYVPKPTKQGIGIAIDIGTTTIAMEAIEYKTAKSLGVYTTVNEQRLYGTDVISRIEYALSDSSHQLTTIIRNQISEGISQLAAKHQFLLDEIVDIAIAGNTVMCHLFLGLSIEGMASHPFTPETTDCVQCDAKQVLHVDNLNCNIHVLPCSSAFIGADVLAGAYSVGMNQSVDPVVLIDLGTNAEMLIGTKEKFVSASAAAGPAFEGGNIKCGVGSIKGAISAVTMKDGILECNTILDGEPTGICGSGLIEIIAELYANGVVDSSGLLSGFYQQNGYLVARSQKEMIYLTQNDIREFQLAKAAVRAGLEILLEKSEYKYQDIKDVYLVGGFGYHLNIEKAIKIGLLPKEWKHKVKLMGNTSLLGCRKFLLEENGIRDILDIKSRIGEVVLAQEEGFHAKYLKCMSF